MAPNRGERKRWPGVLVIYQHFGLYTLAIELGFLTAFLNPSLTQVLSMWLMKKTPQVVKITPRRNRHPNCENYTKEHFFVMVTHLQETND